MGGGIKERNLLTPPRIRARMKGKGSRKSPSSWKSRKRRVWVKGFSEQQEIITGELARFLS